MMRLLRRNWPFFLVIILLVVLQQVLTRGGIEYYMTQITMSACYALVVVGLCLLMGYAGQVSLGHAGFFAIGGYTAAALTLHLHWPSWVGMCAAIVLASVVAFLIGVPVLRLKGHYLAMATLGFGLIIYRIVLGSEWLGQADGLSSVPPLELFDGLRVSSGRLYRVQSYYIVWTAVLLAMWLAANLVRSRVGRALRAIHEDEDAAHSLGINTYRYKLAVFVLSAVFASAGGVLATHFKGSIGPSEATVMYSVRYVAIVAVGGMSSLWGGLLMAIVLNFLSLRGTFGQHDDLVFGGILIGMMLFAPSGLLMAGRSLWQSWRRSPVPEGGAHG